MRTFTRIAVAAAATTALLLAQPALAAIPFYSSQDFENCDFGVLGAGSRCARSGTFMSDGSGCGGSPANMRCIQFYTKVGGSAYASSGTASTVPGTSSAQESCTWAATAGWNGCVENAAVHKGWHTIGVNVCHTSKTKVVTGLVFEGTIDEVSKACVTWI